MTILGPILLAVLILLPVYLSEVSTSLKKVAVLDETGWFYQKFHNQGNVHFYYVDKNVRQARAEALAKGDLLLYIPLPELNIPENAELFSTKQPGLFLRSYIKTVMKSVVENKKLLAQGINPEVIKSVKANINLVTINDKSNRGRYRKTGQHGCRNGTGYFFGDSHLHVCFYVRSTGYERGDGRKTKPHCGSDYLFGEAFSADAG